MAEQSVAVEGNFRVQHADMAVLHDDERVDLQHRHVFLDEGFVEDFCKAHHVGACVAREFQRIADLGGVGVRDAGRRLDRQRHDAIRGVVRDGFDVHAAFGRDNERDLARTTIDQQRAVQFFFDVGAVFDIDAVHLAAGRRCLRRHEVVAEHGLHVLERLFLREAEADAAFFTGFLFDELAFAAAAGVDLRFHDPERTRQRVDRSLRLVHRGDGDALCDRRSERLQDFLRLMLVNVHG